MKNICKKTNTFTISNRNVTKNIKKEHSPIKSNKKTETMTVYTSKQGLLLYCQNK